MCVRTYTIASFISALVAQLDRVHDYESCGQRFESSRVHHFCLKKHQNLDSVLNKS